MDYPHIRANGVCPFCNGGKAQGLIACWPCFRRENLRNGENGYQAAILEQHEQRLIEQQWRGGSDYDGELDERDRRARRPQDYR